MIIVLKRDCSSQQLRELTQWLSERGLKSEVNIGSSCIAVCVIGDTSAIDTSRVSSMEMVDSVKRIQEPYKLASRKAHPDDTVICVGGACIGGGGLTLIAGPCTIESEKQLFSVAKAVKNSGADLLRGGAFKPRTSPYSYQGIGSEALSMLRAAGDEFGLPIVSEIMSPEQLPQFKNVDVIQVGARNMQNFPLLKALGHQDRPVLLKRGFSATYEELLMSAEYIISEGNPNVILCERGIRTFEPSTRFTLDIAAVPSLKAMTHLPVIVDPCHAAGKASLVPSLSMAAVSAGADGLMTEVHSEPKDALCDGPQALRPEQFSDLASKLRSLYDHINK